jgi:Ca-activated chloride channel family protein
MNIRHMTKLAVTIFVALLISACGDSMSDSGMPATSPSDHAANRGAPPPQASKGGQGAGGENYTEWTENNFENTSEKKKSTFSIDVDTASYTVMRRNIQQQESLPAPESVRVEEYINFFDYDYEEPSGDHPMAVEMEMAPSKFGEGKEMLRIGMKGKDVSKEEMSPNNLVFLIDSSGSMGDRNKLPLVKKSLKQLVDNLRPSDSIGIVTYAGSASTVLNPTPVEDKDKIISAVNSLNSAGSTNGEGGIKKAYNLAEDAKIEGGNNRVILATDGAFNVGVRGDQLVKLIEDYRERQITLTTMGFGMGNYNAAQIEKLARKGNGNYFYIDTQREAERIFGEELPSTLEVIAADVKAQVAFNPDVVKEYRLVGYETRKMDNDEFDNDKRDAAEMGPGHTVTALYEVELEDELPDKSSSDIASLAVRYKDNFGEESTKFTTDLKLDDKKDSFDAASSDFKFATAVTEYAEILRQSDYADGAKFGEVKDIAEANSEDDNEYRQEFINLVSSAKALWEQNDRQLR